jgi:hypothetical protein
MPNANAKLAKYLSIPRARHKNKGSSFNSFLREEGILEDVNETVVNKVAAFQKNKENTICD